LQEFCDWLKIATFGIFQNRLTSAKLHHFLLLVFQKLTFVVKKLVSSPLLDFTGVTVQKLEEKVL